MRVLAENCRFNLEFFKSWYHERSSLKKDKSVEGVLKLNEEFCSVKGNLWRTIGAYINSQK